MIVMGRHLPDSPLMTDHPRRMPLLRPCRVAFALLAFLLLPLLAHAQKENNVWYFGRFVGIDFNGANPRLLTDGALNTFEGTASVADRRTGALLFYTDGMTIWNRSHRPMPNGTGLLGDSSTTQAALILSAPGDTNVYYIFTAAPEESGPDGMGRFITQGYNYSVIDMRLDGGLGDVARKNVPIMTPGTEKLTAVRHCNGRDYWVVTHEWLSNRFLVYLLSDTGLSAQPVISSTGPTLFTHPTGYLQASPNGTLLAAAIVGLDQPAVIFPFDNTTGKVGNNYYPLPMIGSRGLYGICFSPDNTKLYVTEGFTHSLYQYDLTSMRYSDIISSKELIYSDNLLFTYGALQRGPDGRIYMARDGDSTLGVITRPNERSAACGFVPRGFSLNGHHSSLGLPNLAGVFIPIDAGADTAICAGDSVKLHGSGEGALRWSPADGLSCTDCTDPIARPLRTTRYILTGSTPGSCRDAVDTVIVTVDVPAVDAGRDTVLCSGQNARLHATGAATYLWTPATGLSCADCPDPIASPAVSTTYTVTGFNARGCSAADTIRVTIFDASSLSVSPDTSICAGGIAHLRASGSGTLRWSPAATLSCTDCADPIASPVVSTTYYITLSGAGGCEVVDSVLVTVLPVPTIVTRGDTTLCGGGSVVLTTKVDGNPTPQDVLWTPAEGLSCTDCISPTASPTHTITYYCVATASGGCRAIDSVTVTVAPLPAADAGSDTTVCAGALVTLTATGGSGYLWSPPEGLSCADCASTTVRPLTTTRYHVRVKSAFGCMAEDSVLVTVGTQLIAKVSGDTVICAGQSAHLRAEGGASYQWQPAAGLDCPACAETDARPDVTTTYHVKVTSGGGCVGEDSVTILVGPAIDVLAHVPADLAVSPGGTVRVPVLLDTPLTGAQVGTIDVAITYRADLLRLEGISQAGHLLEGWRIASSSASAGTSRWTFEAPAGSFLNDAGTLFDLLFTGYLGPTITSDIGLSVVPHGIGCLSVTATPGTLRLDSLCGLSFRLIEPLAGKYALEAITPTPSGPRPEIHFSIGMEGGARLTIHDAFGRLVATPVDGMLGAGSYAVAWDAAAFPSGVYYCRLTSEGWSDTKRLLLVK